MQPSQRSHRPLIMGRNGAVGANHPLATQAGLDILRAGGNAIDAAVAVSLALGVVEPMMSGLGGDGFYHVFLAATGKGIVYNGSGPAPAAATPDRFSKGMDIRGARSASVPACLAAVGAMHAAHGVTPWEQMVAPAIRYASEGYAATHNYRHFAGDLFSLLSSDADSRRAYLPGGEVPPLGGWISQPDLARTLEAIAADGAETFYRGRLAEKIAAGLAARGALITRDDLAACHAEVQTPIGITYRGFEVWQTPPNSTGFVMLEILRIAERFDLARMSAGERTHVLVEAKKRAFLDRERYGGDPRFADIPIAEILGDRAIDAHVAAIDLSHAADLPLRQPEMAGGDTTYFCVMDGQGNAVSGIQSINSAFGSGVTAGDTGILLNNRMAYWHLAEDHPNRLRPGKRVRHTMNAPMVLRDGKVVAVLGTPGADNQVQVNAQVLVNMLDLGADPQAAVEAPRWTSIQVGQGANWPHDGDGSLTIERDVGADVLADLERRGHRLTKVDHLDGPCAMQAIQVYPGGVLAAGSDPRRDGWAGAF